MKNGEAKGSRDGQEPAREEVIPPSKMPKGIALMLRSVLGVDPAQIAQQFEDAFNNMTGFLHHADKRMTHVVDELKATKEALTALQSEVAALRADRQLQPEKPEK